MRKLIITAVLALAVLTSAAECESTGGDVEEPGGGSKQAGGQVINSGDSAYAVEVYRSWGKSGPAGKRYTLNPGKKTSTKIDTDGVCLMAGYVAEVKIRTGPFTFGDRLDSRSKPCRKVSDIEVVTVIAKRR